MNIQEIIYDLKKDGLTDAQVEVAVLEVLENEGYIIDAKVLDVIQHHLKNFAAKEAR